jgi:hypothetical protein
VPFGLFRGNQAFSFLRFLCSFAAIQTPLARSAWDRSTYVSHKPMGVGVAAVVRLQKVTRNPNSHECGYTDKNAMSEPNEIESEKHADDSSNGTTPVDDSGSIARTRIGVVLILVSGVLWFSLFAIPFLPLTTLNKTALGAGVFVGVQLAWWSGAALAGPKIIKKLTGWFRRS